MTNGWVSTSAPYLAPRREGQRDAWSEEAAASGHKGTQRVVQAGRPPRPSKCRHCSGWPGASRWSYGAGSCIWTVSRPNWRHLLPG